MESITTWLASGCDYKEGVQIYAGLHGANANLLRLFGKGHSAANAEKLKYELKKKCAVATTAPAIKIIAATVSHQVKAPVKVAVPESPKGSVLYHQLPQELRQVLLEAHELFTKNCLLKAELNDLPAEKETEAFAIQWQIYQNRLRNKRCWATIDHWQKHKTIPVAPAAINPFKDFTPDQRLKREGNLMSSSSKLRARCREYEAALELATDVGQRTKLERALAKSSTNLLRQENDLALIRKMIAGNE